MSLQKLKQEAAEKINELDDPESIRTPGRTWTRYPEIEIGETSSQEPDLRIEGDAEVLTGEEAVQESGEKLLDLVKMEENRLNALHAANINTIIYIKADGEAEINIVHKGEETFSHIVVETSRNAELELTEEFRNTGVLTSVNEFYVGENSSITYGAIESSDSELTYCRRKAILEDYGQMNWLNGMFSGELKRTEIETVLKGDNSETEKMALWYPTGEQHNDISMKVKHLGENTRCDMKSRAVVDDKARSVYEGLQRVEDHADDTSSFQDEKVLTLSQKAEVDASPKLMIEDPNVEASHAASAGNLPEKEVHYMESRGLSEEKAERLIVKGFFEPAMEEIALPEFKDRVRDEIQGKLER